MSGNHRRQTKRYKTKPSARVRDGLVVARIGGIVILGYGECSSIGSKLLCGRMREGLERIPKREERKEKREDAESGLERRRKRKEEEEEGRERERRGRGRKGQEEEKMKIK